MVQKTCIDSEQLGFKLNKAEVEDGWWKKSYSDALAGVKLANYVASDNDTTTEEESESDSESGESSNEESEEENNSSSDSGSEYDDDDELAFQNIAKKYLKTK